jgi:glutamate carboxypeptidase
MATLDQALAALRRRERGMLALTRRWVEVNSYTENIDGVNRVGAMIAEAFALPSLGAETIPAAKHGSHLAWRTAASGAPILLVGHHDTVFPPGHFEGWHEEGGRARGPGSFDMKGGLAIIWGALAALDEVGELSRLPLVVMSVSDEEVGSPESRPHLEARARGASAALVFESGRTEDRIVTARRGVGAVRAVATGRAAHAGNAHKEGVNAVWAIARFIDRAQRLTDYCRGLTINVGMVKGGTSKNTVPEAAECALDIRFETVADAEALMARLAAAAQESAAEVPGATVELSGGPSRLPMERTAASAALYEEYAACQRAAGLGAGETPMVGGGSDANTVSAVGVPAIDGLGPRGAGFHTTKEYVELASFAPKAEALLRFLWGRRPA